MSDSVQMPALGESVTEGTVTRWLKQVGDTVAIDEPLLEVSTDKVDTEIPSPVAGTLLEILVAEDETVEVGAVLARVGSPDEADATPDAGEEPEGAAEAPAPETVDAAPDAGVEPEPEPTDTAPDAEEQQAAQVPAEVAEAEQPATEQPATEQSEVEQPEAEQSEVEQPEAEQPEVEAPAASDQGGVTEDVRMPALGESVTEGTVTRWLKQVGDTVAVDEPLLEVSTDKVDTEIPSPFAGTLVEILVAEDETVEVGAPLARVGSAGGSAGPAQAAPPSEVDVEGTAPSSTDTSSPPPVVPAQRSEPLVSQAVSPAEAPAEAPVERPAEAPTAPAAARAAAPAGGYLTPLVRKLAAKRGVDLSDVTGTGVGGRIRKEDVVEAAERADRERAEQERTAAAAQRTPPAAPVERPASHRAAPAAPEVSPLRGTTEKASRLRQIIASRMVEALQSMAQLTTVVEVDVTKVARLRARAKDDFGAREGVNLSYLPFFVLAATEALKAHPKINGVLEGNQITYHGVENVGIAVDTDRGLVVPVIRDAGDLNLAGIGRKIADLAARTRDNKVTPDELSGATFTVTNTGWAGAVFDTPIVPGGTSAILGTGAIVKRPVVATDEDGADYIAVRSMCYLSLSYDHRLVDGADASRYLATVKKRLEDGDFESELGL
jgi:2-oxoglutarate dehydrogenase E2 component (dihydrolipoamide succinyltransferase)